MCKVAKHKEHLGNLLQDGDEGTPNPHPLLQQRSLNALGWGGWPKDKHGFCLRVLTDLGDSTGALGGRRRGSQV